jgi:hypothetical protein
MVSPDTIPRYNYALIQAHLLSSIKTSHYQAQFRRTMYHSLNSDIIKDIRSWYPFVPFYYRIASAIVSLTVCVQ